MSHQPRYTVSLFLATVNQILETAMPIVEIEGEVTGFRVSQEKWVSFRIKDDESVLDCFMGVWQLRVPVEDGMTVVVRGNPRIAAKWGKFSISVQQVTPSGEGAINRAFQLLKIKLEKEGLFDTGRKRTLPDYPGTIGIISSEQAAGYADFTKIMKQRWPLAKLQLISVAVQGASSADQVIAALDQFNKSAKPPEVIAIIRGGGTVEDLASFNDEQLVRSIAASRVPTVVGVGHETDMTLAELAADIRASTPSNAAELLTPEQNHLKRHISLSASNMESKLRTLVREIALRNTDFRAELHVLLNSYKNQVTNTAKELKDAMNNIYLNKLKDVDAISRLIIQTSPRRQLERGFSLVRKHNNLVTKSDQVESGDQLDIEFFDNTVSAKVS